MVTESMGINAHKPPLCGYWSANRVIRILCGIQVVLVTPAGIAGEYWQATPSLSFKQMFSDNLTLSNQVKKSGFVTELSPGLSISALTARNRFNLNYRLQGLYNVGSDQIDTYHQLQMSALSQLIQNQFFLQTSGSISQQNISNANIATDNLSGTPNQSEVKTFSISPYWTPSFGSLATGVFKLGYANTSVSNKSNANQSIAGSPIISDSDTFTKQVSLSSGKKFQKTRWSLNFSDQDQMRQGFDDVVFRQFLANSRYFINRDYNLVAQAGYEHNSFQTITNSSKNGFFYTLGAQWRPSHRFAIEAGVGNNQYVTLQLAPFDNLFGNITYNHKDVGLNRGSSWQANLNYKTNNSVSSFKFFQDTTTVQQVLLERQVFNTADQFGNAVADPVTQQPVQFLTDLPNLVNDVIVRRRGDVSFAYRFGKSQVSSALYNEHRTYQLSGFSDTVYGISGSLNWQFEPRLNFYLRPVLQSTQGATSNERYDIALGLSRSIAVQLNRNLLMNTQFEFRHINQVSNVINNEYTENRISANFFVRY